MAQDYEFLSRSFIEAMNDIGRYGHEKYGERSFQHRRLQGDMSRGDMERTQPAEIARHASTHFQAHLDGVPHDHFKTRKHQLAAAAFNAMMEFYFSGLEEEEGDTADVALVGGSMNNPVALDREFEFFQPMQQLVVPVFVKKAGSPIVVEIQCHPARVALVTDVHGNNFHGPDRARKNVEKWYCLVAVKSGENAVTVTLTGPALAVVKVWLEE